MKEPTQVAAIPGLRECRALIASGNESARTEGHLITEAVGNRGRNKDGVVLKVGEEQELVGPEHARLKAPLDGQLVSHILIRKAILTKQGKRMSKTIFCPEDKLGKDLSCLLVMQSSAFATQFNVSSRQTSFQFPADNIQ